MIRIKNTADDRTKHLQHRTASQFELEPNLGGRRIRLGTFLDITDEHYARVKPMVDAWEKKGMVDVTKLDPDASSQPTINADGLKLGGPTLEEWKKSGYSADNYPPEGFAEVFSPGLVAFRREQEDVAVKKAAEAGASTTAEAMQLPVEPPVPLLCDQSVVDLPAPEQPVPAPSPVVIPPLPPQPSQTQVAAQAAANKDKSKKKLF